MRCRGLEAPPDIRFFRALYSYDSPARLLVRAWKFSRHPMLARFIARSFCEALRDISSRYPLHDFVIVPAPSSPGRWKRTGRDPLLSVAREFSRRSGLPLLRCLVRARSRSQKTLDRRGREDNLRGKIHCTRKAPLHILLIDDVVTTGATMRICVESLLEAGTRTLCCLVFCYD